jgi:hypothetical protein
MKIAFFSESPADEAALAILVSGILGEEVEQASLQVHIQARGSSNIDKILPTVIRAVNYNSDAEALVVVSDSDDTPVHLDSHDGRRNLDCRMCQLRNTVAETLTKLNAVPGKDILKVAVGVPVPAIEAWYLCGINPHVNEATWIRKQNGEKIKYDRKKLKFQVYNTDHPSLELETEHAIECATRLVSEFEQLDQLFPQGFRSFANEIRSWKQ